MKYFLRNQAVAVAVVTRWPQASVTNLLADNVTDVTSDPKGQFTPHSDPLVLSTYSGN